MQYIEDMATVQENAQTEHGRRLVKRLHTDVQWFSANFKDDPKELSGWGHHYFCLRDGAFLHYDRTSPFSHRCPICGNVYKGGDFDAAWLCLYRYEALMSAVEAAVLYRLEGNTAYLRHFRRILGFYSDHYEEFEAHGKGPTTSGNGKIMPQALNEAIFLVKAVNGLEILRGSLPDPFVQDVCRKLLLPGARFVNEQKKIIHNIPCWINSAVGAVGLFTGDDELVRLAFDSPLGLADQVRRGVTESHFWYEGSIHYNCFTLEAFLNQILMARIHQKKIPDDVDRAVYDMLLAPCRLTFSNGVLPNPNDGWPNLNLKTYSYLYEMAAKLYDSDDLRRILSDIYSQQIRRTALLMSSPVYAGDYCLEWLLFSRPMRQEAKNLGIWSKTVNFEPSCYAMLREENCEVFFKYGHRSPSHAHPDKMNLEVMAFGTPVSRDLSNCGYAAPLCNEYHRTSVAHCTVVLDGHSHPDTQLGECRFWRDRPAALSAHVKDAYPGVDFVRCVTLQKNGFSDRFDVHGEKGHVIDWFFHVEGELVDPPKSESASLGFGQDGYQHLKDVQVIRSTAPVLRLHWRFANGVFGIQEVNMQGVTAYLCKSYDNPVNRLRRTVILRVHGRDAEFSQNWQFRKEEEDT